jgi:hypothetical protein
MSNGSDKLVTITMSGGLPVPNPDPVQVKKDNQKVRWCAAFPFTITMEGWSGSSSPHGGDCENELKSRLFSETGNFKYDITANGVTNDPTIEVIP